MKQSSHTPKIIGDINICMGNVFKLTESIETVITSLSYSDKHKRKNKKKIGFMDSPVYAHLCLVNLIFAENLFSQNLHVIGLSPVCVHSCPVKYLFTENLFS